MDKLNVSDVIDLPDELIDQLKLSKGVKQDMKVIELIKGNGGVLSLNRIIIEYYRVHQCVLNRKDLRERLNKMCMCGLLSNHKGLKDVYQLSFNSVYVDVYG